MAKREDIRAQVNILRESDRLGDRLEAVGGEVRIWVNNTKEQLLFELAKLGLRDRADLLRKVQQKVRFDKVGVTAFKARKEEYLYDSVRGGVNNRNGGIESAWLSVARHGIFIEHGVGKHRPIGSDAADSAAQPWLTPVLPDAVETLATILAEYYADVVSAELGIYVPGILDTRKGKSVNAGVSRAERLSRKPTKSTAEESKVFNISYQDFIDAMNADIRSQTRRQY